MYYDNAVKLRQQKLISFPCRSDTVKAAADRKGRLFSPPTPYYQDSYESRVSRNLFSPPREISQPPVLPSRLFTPTPFSPPPPQIFTPPPVAQPAVEEEKFFVPLASHRPINFTSERLFSPPKAESRLFTPQPFAPSPATFDQQPEDRGVTPSRPYSQERVSQFGVRELSQPRGWSSQYAGEKAFCQTTCTCKTFSLKQQIALS